MSPWQVEPLKTDDHPRPAPAPPAPRRGVVAGPEDFRAQNGPETAETGAGPVLRTSPALH